MRFEENGHHQRTILLNATAYQSVGANFTFNVGSQKGVFNLTGKKYDGYKLN